MAQVVHYLHPLRVDRVVHIGPVRLALEVSLPDQRAVGPLEVVDEQRPGRNPAAHGLPHARRAGLPVAADDRDRVLVDVDDHADAQLLTGQAALARLPIALGEVGVVDVGLVDPDGVAQHDPVLVAGHRGEHAVPPLEGGLVGDAAQLRRALDGDVVAHGPDEGDPGGERLAAVLEDGAREGGEPPAAAAAAPPREAGRGGAVPLGAVGDLGGGGDALLAATLDVGRRRAAERPCAQVLNVCFQAQGDGAHLVLREPGDAHLLGHHLHLAGAGARGVHLGHDGHHGVHYLLG